MSLVMSSAGSMIRLEMRRCAHWFRAGRDGQARPDQPVEQSVEFGADVGRCLRPPGRVEPCEVCRRVLAGGSVAGPHRPTCPMSPPGETGGGARRDPGIGERARMGTQRRLAEVGMRAVEIDRPEGRLEPVVRVEARRTDQGADDLAADAHRHEARADRRARPARGAAGRARGIERVARGSRIVEGELSRHRLAEDHGARLAQPRDQCAVEGGTAAPENGATVFRGHVVAVEEVLDAHRHAVDGRQGRPFGVTCRRRVGGSARALVVEVREGLNLAVARLDGGETALQIRPRRVRACQERRAPGRGRSEAGWPERVVDLGRVGRVGHRSQAFLRGQP
jgi:hypothetical protein